MGTPQRYQPTHPGPPSTAAGVDGDSRSEDPQAPWVTQTTTTLTALGPFGENMSTACVVPTSSPRVFQRRPSAFRSFFPSLLLNLPWPRTESPRRVVEIKEGAVSEEPGIGPINSERRRVEVPYEPGRMVQHVLNRTTILTQRASVQCSLKFLIMSRSCVQNHF